MGSSVIFSIANEIHFRLPVRVLEEGEKSLEIKKDDFNLFINDSQREIIDLRKRKKSLGIKPDMGRDFIFFDLTPLFDKKSYAYVRFRFSIHFLCDEM